MKFSSALLITIPTVLTSWTVAAEPTADLHLARLTARNLAARHEAEWDVFQRDFEPETLDARGEFVDWNKVYKKKHSRALDDDVEARGPPSPGGTGRRKHRRALDDAVEARGPPSPGGTGRRKHRREVEPETLNARRSCKTSKDLDNSSALQEVRPLQPLTWENLSLYPSVYRSIIPATMSAINGGAIALCFSQLAEEQADNVIELQLVKTVNNGGDFINPSIMFARDTEPAAS
ncbi:hypothetical protein FPV67DRAFT_1449455 [Lyophyllum atratum]|nr:hypothetical protein FPV67DRAFT_1449455 [Lyophyllum atratum]